MDRYFPLIFCKIFENHSGIVNLKPNFTILDIDDQKTNKTSFRVLQD